MAGRRFIRAVIAMGLAFSAGTAPLLAQASQQFDHAGLARQALDRHIRPGYADLANAARVFRDTLRRTCRSPSHHHRQALERDFRALARTWGRIEHVNFGPVTTNSRRDRILFWPDRRRLGARQLADALTRRTPDVTEPARLATKSAALQGLGALDGILFDAAHRSATASDLQHRCAFADAVAANLATTSEAIAREWAATDGFARLWLKPGPGNPAFAAANETTATLAGAFDQGLDLVRDQRMLSSLGFNRLRRKGPLPLAQSGHGITLMAGNMAGLLQLYTEGGLLDAFAATGSPPSARAQTLAQRAQQLALNLDRISGQLAQLAAQPLPLDEPTYRTGVIASGFPLKLARRDFSTLAAEAAGLPRLFTAADGD